MKDDFLQNSIPAWRQSWGMWDLKQDIRRYYATHRRKQWRLEEVLDKECISSRDCYIRFTKESKE